MSSATPSDVVEWDTNTHYCVLDLDFHDNNAPACNDLYAAAAALRPTPQQYWLSRSCGLHAIYMSIDPFTAIEPGDLTLDKGQEYVVLDDSQDHWWQVQNKLGEVGFIPSNYVKEKDELGLQNFDW